MATHAPSYEPRRAFAPLTAPPAITPPPLSRHGFLAGLEQLQHQATSDRIIISRSYRDVTAAIQTGAFAPRGR